MSDKYFIDTNIFVYSLDTDEPEKASVAEKLITAGASTGLGAISYQVVQEFFNVGLRGFRAKLTASELESYFFRVL